MNLSFEGELENCRKIGQKDSYFWSALIYVKNSAFRHQGERV